MKTVKMLKNFGAYKVDELVDLDEATCKDYIASGLAKEVSGDPLKDAEAEIETAMAGMVERTLAKQMKRMGATFDASEGVEPHITVSDNTDYEKTGGFKDFAHFFTDVARASAKSAPVVSETLAKWQMKHAPGVSMDEGTPEEGGFLVPQEYRAQLLQTRLESSIVRPRATFIPMRTSSIAMPYLGVADGHTGLVGSTGGGGIAVRRPGEGEQKLASVPTGALTTLTLHKLIVLINVTDELREDSMISLEPLLTTRAGANIAFAEDSDYLTGTGVIGAGGANSQSQGVLNSPALIVVPATGVANEILWADVTQMFSRLYPPSLNTAVWVASPSCFPTLTQMTVGNTPVWIPSPTGAPSGAGSPYGTLLGRALFLSSKVPPVGQQGCIGLYDFKEYLVGGKPTGLKSDTSIHLHFDYDITTYRYVLRHDGRGWWPNTLQPANGGPTLSPFVTLGASAISS